MRIRGQIGYQALQESIARDLAVGAEAAGAIDVRDAYGKDISAGTRVILCGFTTHEHATSKAAEPMVMRAGAKTPYGVYRTPISQLQLMSDFRPFLKDLADSKGIEIPI